MNDQTKGVLLTAIGVLLISPDSLLIRLMDGPVFTTVMWRAVFAFCAMSCAMFWIYGTRLFTVYRGLGRAGLIFIIFMSTGTSLFVIAAQLTAVANTVFIVSTSPVFAALISRFFLGERMSRRMVITIILALVGVAIIAFGSYTEAAPEELRETAWLGDLAALASAATLAVGFTAARAGRAVSMVPAVGLSYLLTSLVTLPLALQSSSFIPAHPEFWIYGALLGAVFVPLGASFMSLGPRYIPSAEVSLLLLLEAILAPLMVWAILGENPGIATLIGGAMVLGVLAISNAVAMRRSRS